MSDKLKTLVERLTDWLDDARVRNRLVPAVSNLRDRVRWGRRAIAARPDAAAAVPMLNVEDEAAFALEQLEAVLPPVEKFDFYAVEDGVNSIAGSTGAGVMRYVVDVGQLSAAAQAWATRQMELYEELQRPGRIRELISRVMPQVVSRFDEAENAFTLRAVDASQDSSTAGAFRTLLEGIDGRVQELAKRWPTENMTWKKAIECLRLRAPANTWASKQIVREAETHGRLRDELSNVFKQRRRGELVARRAQVLDHVEALLSAVEFLRRSSKDADQPATP